MGIQFGSVTPIQRTYQAEFRLNPQSNAKICDEAMQCVVLKPWKNERCIWPISFRRSEKRDDIVMFEDRLDLCLASKSLADQQ